MSVARTNKTVSKSSSSALVPVSNGQKRIAKTETTTVTTNRKKPKARKRRRNKLSGNSIANDYIKCISDPFLNPPAKIGFGCLSNSSLATGYYKYTSTIPIGDTGVILTHNPDAFLKGSSTTAAGIITNKLNNWGTIQYYNIDTPDSASSLNVVVGPANYNALNAAIYTYRVVAAAVRVSISHPTTSSSGVIHAVRVNGCTDPLAMDLTPSQIGNLAATQTDVTIAGTRDVQVNWLPSDMLDYTFSLTSTAQNGVGIRNPLAICLTGFPAGTRIFVEFIQHVEYQSGTLIPGIIDNFGEGITNDSTLASIFPSIESMFGYVQSAIGSLSQAVEWSIERTPYALREGGPVHRLYQAYNNYNNNFRGGVFDNGRVRIEPLSVHLETEEKRNFNTPERRESIDSLYKEAQDISLSLSNSGLEESDIQQNAYVTVLRQQLDNLLNQIARVKSTM